MSGAELMQVSPSCPFRVNARSTFCTHSAAAHARVWQVRRRHVCGFGNKSLLCNSNRNILCPPSWAPTYSPNVHPDS